MSEFKRSGQFFVYILQCKKGTYYTGYTTDLKRRIKIHNSGKGAKYLRGKLPVELVFFKEYKYYKRAVKEEIRIKTLDRKGKENLIFRFCR